ncbi:hypothetical protein B0H13DRAFT_2520669 [Mycena leptocephala]|nr:hypothetical protein B0H13DRAFT_2520669 [Mycena leptocephala]
MAFTQSMAKTGRTAKGSRLPRKKIDFIRRVSAVENKKHHGILRCPTMTRIFAAFNRDLALITETVWRENLSIIRAEFKYMLDAMIGRRNDKVRCSYCLRSKSGCDSIYPETEREALSRMSRFEAAFHEARSAQSHYTSKLPSKYFKDFRHTFVNIPSRIHASNGLWEMGIQFYIFFHDLS